MGPTAISSGPCTHSAYSDGWPGTRPADRTSATGTPGDDDLGGPRWPKTVIRAPERTPEHVRAALLHRRFYAVGPDEGGLRLELTADHEPMGARLERPVGAPVRIAASVSDPSLRLELVTSGEKVVATATG